MKNAQKVGLGLLSAIGLVALIYFFQTRGTEHTDDAQIEGHIVTIAPRVPGQVQKVLVKDNQLVKKGDPLVELDSEELSARLAAARADLSAALASQESSESDVTAARSRLRLAELELSRVKRLVKEGVLAQAEVDTRQSQYDQAKAAYDQAVARVGEKKGQAAASEGSPEPIGAAAAKVMQSEAALQLASVNASYATIRAPVSGVVSRRSVEEGQMVAPMNPLMALVDLEDVWIVANFKEDQLAHMRVGQAARIKVDSYPGLTLEGEVSSFAAATGAKFSLLPPDNATGNFVKVVQRVPVLIRLKKPQNPEGEQPLRPGMSADVIVYTER